jgi:hypothetical protein
MTFMGGTVVVLEYEGELSSKHGVKVGVINHKIVLRESSEALEIQVSISAHPNETLQRIEASFASEGLSSLQEGLTYDLLRFDNC